MNTKVICGIRETRAPDVGPRCEYCDGTGDVHGFDGEWHGRCSCDAGTYPVRTIDAPRVSEDEQIEALRQALHHAMALIEGANGVEIRRDQSWHMYREGFVAALEGSGPNRADAHQTKSPPQREES